MSKLIDLNAKYAANDVLGVFAWEAKNMYLNDSALRTFTREKAARAYCDQLNETNDSYAGSKLYHQGGYVIRPLRKTKD
jgi:hypothetical protein